MVHVRGDDGEVDAEGHLLEEKAAEHRRGSCNQPEPCEGCGQRERERHEKGSLPKERGEPRRRARRDRCGDVECGVGRPDRERLVDAGSLEPWRVKVEGGPEFHEEQGEDRRNPPKLGLRPEIAKASSEHVRERARRPERMRNLGLPHAERDDEGPRRERGRCPCRCDEPHRAPEDAAHEECHGRPAESQDGRPRLVPEVLPFAAKGLQGVVENGGSRSREHGLTESEQNLGRREGREILGSRHRDEARGLRDAGQGEHGLAADPVGEQSRRNLGRERRAVVDRLERRVLVEPEPLSGRQKPQKGNRRVPERGRLESRHEDKIPGRSGVPARARGRGVGGGGIAHRRGDPSARRASFVSRFRRRRIRRAVPDDCIFCKILDGAIPSTRVLESANAIAIDDKFPQAPVHCLVIPRRHVSSLHDADEGDGALLGELLLLARKVAIAKGLEGKGYRVITNIGRDGGQGVFHLHVHVLGGKRLGPKMVAEG